MNIQKSRCLNDEEWTQYLGKLIGKRQFESDEKFRESLRIKQAENAEVISKIYKNGNRKMTDSEWRLYLRMRSNSSLTSNESLWGAYLHKKLKPLAYNENIKDENPENP